MKNNTNILTAISRLEALSNKVKTIEEQAHDIQEEIYKIQQFIYSQGEAEQ